MPHVDPNLIKSAFMTAMSEWTIEPSSILGAGWRARHQVHGVMSTTTHQQAIEAVIDKAWMAAAAAADAAWTPSQRILDVTAADVMSAEFLITLRAEDFKPGFLYHIIFEGVLYRSVSPFISEGLATFDLRRCTDREPVTDELLAQLNGG